MKFEIRSLSFDNLLIYETRQLREDWQEGILLMEDFTLIKDIYQNGPIFFSVTPEENEDKFGRFTYYLPINEKVKVEEDPNFSFLDKLFIEEALGLRQADQEVDFHAAYKKIKDYAHHHNISLENTFYCVLLEIYGEYIIDLFVPVKKRGDQL
ncbi:DUF5085 family protein [Pseudogracilibacillus sp. SO30301A]|uniref:DUF5085 family protein n=1 Tax=Pseudogracilibacillus sp. SO30301A TaxID=3098291 RepID=UPI00300E1347